MSAIEIRIMCGKCRASNRVELAFNGPPGRSTCRKCSKVLFDYEEVRGFVYIVSNPAMPGLVKIGYTTRTVNERLAELNHETGVPSPFVIECYWASGDPVRAESTIHRRLMSHRIPRKEFFRLPIREAIGQVQQILDRKPSYVQKKWVRGKLVWGRIGPLLSRLRPGNLARRYSAFRSWLRRYS